MGMLYEYVMLHEITLRIRMKYFIYHTNGISKVSTQVPLNWWLTKQTDLQ